MHVRNQKGDQETARLVDEALRDAPPLCADQIAELRLIIHGMPMGGTS